MSRSLLAALAVVLSGASPGFAHTGGSTGYAAIAVDGKTVRYSLTLWPAALPAAIGEELGRARAGDLASRDRLLAAIRDKIALSAQGTRCTAGAGTLLAPEKAVDGVTVAVDFACADVVRDLAIRDDLFDFLGTDHHTLARVDSSGRTEQLAFEPSARERTVSLDRAAGGVGSFLLLGVHHILSGWDHLLFLLALMLRGGRLPSLLKIVTAFTLAHSITLGLAVLGVVTLPDRLVESVIAASIAYVALENLLARDAPSHRWLVSFAFGLVHGFGFAAALGPLDLPRTGLAGALLAFNLGVELGQAAVILVVLPGLLWLRRRAWEAWLVRGASAALVIVGLAVFVQRLLA
jgi:hydrogenase/urease accessory protein HupE